MKKNYLVLLITFISALVLLVSCDSSSSSGGTATPSELEGSWYTSGGNAGEHYAVLVTLADTDFERIVFEEKPDDMIQSEGGRGTYTVSGDELTVSITEEWDEDGQMWADTISTDYDITYSIDGSTLTMDIPGAGEITLTKNNFVAVAALAGTTWNTAGEPDELVLNTDGTYTYTYGSGPDYDYTASGTWEATSTLLRTITTEQDGGQLYVDNLYQYTLEGGYLILSWDDSEKLRYSSAE